MGLSRESLLTNRSSGSTQMLSEANYGQFPELIVNGHVDATFAYMPVHLDYMLFELMKNAYRATVEHARQRTSCAPKRPDPPS